MSGIKNQQLLAQRIAIREAYLSEAMTNQELCQRFNLSIDTLKDWIKIGRYGDLPWGILKKEKQLAQRKELLEKASINLPSIHKTSTEILDFGLGKVYEGLMAGRYEGREVEVCKTVVDVMVKANKVLRLDSGQSTQNMAIAVSKTEESNLKEIQDCLEGLVGEEIEIREEQEPV